MSALIALATEIVVLHTHPLPHNILCRCVRTHSYNLQGEGESEGEGEGRERERGYSVPASIHHTQTTIVSWTTNLSHCLVARCEGDLGYGLCHCRAGREKATQEHHMGIQLLQTTMGVAR